MCVREEQCWLDWCWDHLLFILKWKHTRDPALHYISWKCAVCVCVCVEYTEAEVHHWVQRKVTVSLAFLLFVSRSVFFNYSFKTFFPFAVFGACVSLRSFTSFFLVLKPFQRVGPVTRGSVFRVQPQVTCNTTPPQKWVVPYRQHCQSAWTALKSTFAHTDEQWSGFCFLFPNDE